MADNQNQNSGEKETMQGVLREKPKHATSFADNQYAGDSEPGPEEAQEGGDAGGANVSRQGGGSDSSKQGGNTGSTPNASG